MKALSKVQLSHFLGCHCLSPAMLLLPGFQWLLNSLRVLLSVTRAVCAGLLHSACSEIFYYMASKIYTLFSTKKDNSSPVWPRKYQPTLQYCHAAFGSTFGNQRLEYPRYSCSLAVTAGPWGTQATSWSQALPLSHTCSSPITWYIAPFPGFTISSRGFPSHL